MHKSPYYAYAILMSRVNCFNVEHCIKHMTLINVEVWTFKVLLFTGDPFALKTVQLSTQMYTAGIAKFYVNQIGVWTRMTNSYKIKRPKLCKEYTVR